MILSEEQRLKELEHARQQVREWQATVQELQELGDPSSWAEVPRPTE